MKRKSILASLVALLVCLGGIAPSSAADKVKVVALEGSQLFPVQIMQTKGIAAKHGIEIDLQRVASPTASYTVMQSGDFHIGFGGWLSVAVLRSKGFKLSNVYSMVSYTNDVMVKADSPIRNMSELKGKRIGLFGGANAATTWLFRVVAVKHFGFDPTRDAKIHFGAPPLLIGMLEKGELDAILILDPFITQLLETGKFKSIANLGRIWREKSGQEPMLVAVTVNEPWAKANPDVTRRFVAAFREALIYLRNRPEVWPEIAKAMRIKTEKGTKLLHERTASALITRWDRKFIDDQYAYAEALYKTFGGNSDIPEKIPEGTFDMSYAP
jgi:NitT/TauT family transport system substrate-binding protein